MHTIRSYVQRIALSLNRPSKRIDKKRRKSGVVMSEEASRVISPELFHWATGNRPITKLSGETEHISLARSCDIMTIVPTTLNTLIKIAYGVTDEIIPLIAITFLGYSKRLLIAPVMHREMTLTPQYREAVGRIKNIKNIILVEPIEEEGRLKLPEVEFLANIIETVTLRDIDYKGKRVLVTSGPTREYIDRIRFISNPSSGKMGASLAWELYARGADVVVVHGPSIASYPPWIKRIQVETTEEMAQAVENLGDFDIAFFAAAPADYRPKEVFDGKLDSKDVITLELAPTPKVALRAKAKKRVGFTAVVGDNVIDIAIQKLEAYDFDIIVANRVDRKDIGFTSDLNEVYIVTKDGKVKHVPKLPKLLVARSVVDEARKLF